MKHETCSNALPAALEATWNEGFVSSAAMPATSMASWYMSSGYALGVVPCGPLLSLAGQTGFILSGLLLMSYIH